MVISTPESGQAEPARARFDSHDDALDYARNIVEDSNRWLATHALDIAERYKRGVLEVCVVCRSGSDAEKFHLVFCVIPDRGLDGRAVTKELRLIEPKPARRDANGAEDRVFVGITELVQCPKEVIPSFVWLERAHEVNDIIGQVFAASVDNVLQLRCVISEGEPGGLPFPAAGNADDMTGLVESGTKVIDGVEGDTRQSVWHGFNELELMYLLRCFRVNLSDMSVGVTLVELGNLPLKITDVILRPLNHVL